MLRLLLRVTLLAAVCVASGCQGSVRHRVAGWLVGDPAARYGSHSAPVTTPRPIATPHLTASASPTTGQSGAANFEQARQSVLAGQTAEARKDFREAQAHYQKALSLSPGYAAAHHRLAVIADQEQNFPAAEMHYLSALRLTPNNPDLLSDLGYSYLLQKRYVESEPYLTRANQLSPSHPTATNNLGMLYARQNRPQQALAMFRRVGSEEDAQQKLSQFFPGGVPELPTVNGGGVPTMVASQGAADNVSPEVLGLRAAMEQARIADQERRQPAVRSAAYDRHGVSLDEGHRMRDALARIDQAPPRHRVPVGSDVDPRDSMPLWNPPPAPHPRGIPQPQTIPQQPVGPAPIFTPNRTITPQSFGSPPASARPQAMPYQQQPQQWPAAPQAGGQPYANGQPMTPASHSVPLGMSAGAGMPFPVHSDFNPQSAVQPQLPAAGTAVPTASWRPTSAGSINDPMRHLYYNVPAHNTDAQNASLTATPATYGQPAAQPQPGRAPIQAGVPQPINFQPGQGPGYGF